MSSAPPTGGVSTAGAHAPAVELVGVSKRYPGVQALDSVTIDVRQGEIHALVGENGAGKSTLVGCLTGLVQPDAGTIALDGAVVAIHGPGHGQHLGISVIPQEPLSVPRLSAGRNVLLGRERVLSARERLTPVERSRVEDVLRRAGATFAPGTQALDLSVPEIRLIQIARTLTAPGDVIVLDEPTAVLSEADAGHFLDRLVALRDAGKAVLYVSHRLSEVLQISDRVTVLRDGRSQGTFAASELDKAKLISMMAKAAGVVERTSDRPPGRVAPGRVVLDATGLIVSETTAPIGLTVRAGEIVGIAGVQGSGFGRLLRALAGLDRPLAGEVAVDGARVAPGSPRRAYRRGLVYVPADRRRSAIVPQLGVRANLALPARSGSGRLGFRRRQREVALARRSVDLFRIRAATIEAPAATLSGGNQQKLALARALESSPKVLLVEEPTQGIDVPSKVEVRELIRDLVAEREMGVVLASSEFEDVLGLASTIHVMCKGRLVATLDGETATYEELLYHALP